MPWSKQKAPGATKAGGYGKPHQKLRAQWAPLVAAGGVNCWRCGKPIKPGAKWHLGHDDWNRGVYRGPEHASCNLTGAAKKARRIQMIAKRKPPSVIDRW